MANPRESLGAVPCLCCAQSVPVKRSTGGAVSVSCPWCDLSAYAKAGTEAFRRIMAKLPQVPNPEKSPVPELTAPVAKPKPKNLFGV